MRNLKKKRILGMQSQSDPLMFQGQNIFLDSVYVTADILINGSQVQRTRKLSVNYFQ